MPVLSRRQPSLDLRGKTTTAILSSADNMLKEPSWLAAEDIYEAPQKGMDFATNTPPRQLKSRSKTRSNLRLTTQTSLHERYQSSEEEASPSPEEYTSADESLSSESVGISKTNAIPMDLGIEIPSDTDDDYDALPHTTITTALAVSISILNAGRPRLISIAALAPMQKRKRSIPAPVTAVPSTYIIPTVETRSPTSPTAAPPKKRSSSIRPKPSVQPIWLSKQLDVPEEDNMSLSEAEEADQLLRAGEVFNFHNETESLSSDPPTEEEEIYYMPQSPTPTTYAEYDPYSLDPPKLSGPSIEFAARKSSLSSYRAHKSRGEESRPKAGARKGSWMGFGKSLGLSRRVNAANASKEKGKFVPRGALEKVHVPSIPAFGFEAEAEEDGHD